MQVDNQTITKIIKNAVHASIKPDYVGWVIGIVGVLVGAAAIILAIIFHISNTHLRRKLEQEKKIKKNEVLIFYRY